MPLPARAPGSAPAPGPRFLRDRRVARGYFGAQALAGGLWWWGVFALDGVRAATLGGLDPVLVFWLDLPLFVGTSALAALGVRAAATVVTAWTAVVAVGMVGYATATGLAGWGAILMIAAAGASLGAALILHLGRVPSEWLLVGPLAARTGHPRSTRGNLWLTAAQTSVFWALFLGALPLLIVALERRWGLALSLPLPWRLGGALLFLGGSTLGLWAAATLAARGRGTPLPATTAAELVRTGPYRLVRNPMAVGSIAQGVAVGLMASSWLVVLYALAGAVIWDWLVRPHEEAELAARFGTPFHEYRDAVSCWVPRMPRRARAETAGAPPQTPPRKT